MRAAAIDRDRRRRTSRSGATRRPASGSTSRRSVPSSTGSTTAAQFASTRGIVALDGTKIATLTDALTVMQRAEHDYRVAAAFIAAHDSSYGRGDTDRYRSRLAALDKVSDAALQAVNASPDDPILNQYLLSARSAREVTLQQLGGTLPGGRPARELLGILMRYTRSIAVLSLAAALAAPASSQEAPLPRHRRRPRPRPARSARNWRRCARRSRSLRVEVDKRYETAIDAHEAMLEKNDSASQAAYYRRARATKSSKRAYDQFVMRMMSVEISVAQRRGDEIYMDPMTIRVAPRPPSGWLGITFSGSFTTYSDSGRRVMRFKEYPVVESVEPDSPAERAGVESQDLVLALAGRDVLKGTPTFQELLRPGNKLTLKLKRGKATLDRHGARRATSG